MWVLAYKFDTHGFLEKYKARLVVCGDLHYPHKTDIYAATLAAKTFRSMMAIVAAFQLEAFQVDAVNAFTNSKLDETVYSEPPDGFKQDWKALLLERALYGLRRSPLLWLKRILNALKKLGLITVSEDKYLFINDWLIVFFYVDDIVLVFRQQYLQKYQAFLKHLLSRYGPRS